MTKRLRAVLTAGLKLALLVGIPLGLVLLLATTRLGPRAVDASREALRRLTRRTTTVGTPAPVVVERLQALERLETVKQVSHHVVQVKSSSPLLGDYLSKDELVLMAQVEVVAGLDLNGLTAEQVAVEGTAVTLTLPPAQLFSVSLDEHNSRVCTRDRGLLVFNLDKDLERRARIEAVQAARAAALQQGVLKTAQTNAEKSLEALLKSLGFETVTFTKAG